MTTNVLQNKILRIAVNAEWLISNKQLYKGLGTPVSVRSNQTADDELPLANWTNAKGGKQKPIDWDSQQTEKKASERHLFVNSIKHYITNVTAL